MMQAGRNYVIKGRVDRPVYLPASLYDQAKAQGFDMRGYFRIEPIPVDKPIAK